MELTNLLIMRHELLLTAVVVLLIFAELYFGREEKDKVIPIAAFLFLVNTVVGFLPATTGTLFGGMFRSTEMTMLMKNILNIGVLIIFLQSASWLKKDENKNRVSEFFLLILSTLIGLNFLISSGDFLMFFTGLELATIPLATLAAYEVYRARSAEAGIKFILSAAFSTGVTLFGVSMIYGTIGSIYFDEVSAAFTGNPLQVLAFIFFFSGLAFKISIVPFHLWTADVYEGAPVNITSYLSVISKGASVFILAIVLFTVFQSVGKLGTEVLYITSILTMTIGNLFAMRQNNLKRFLAFSSIAQAGFILLGIIGGAQFGMATVIYFVLVYIFSNLGAFGVVAAISAATGKENMDDYNGLYHTNPLLSLVMMLSLFSLAGIPPVAGFFGKFFLFAAAAKQGYYVLVIIAVANATIALYYYLLVVKAMFINKSETPVAHFRSDFPTRLALIICSAGIFAAGFASVIFEKILSISSNF